MSGGYLFPEDGGETRVRVRHPSDGDDPMHNAPSDAIGKEGHF
jgi:hypothetical protein